jgi:hypothetical protein
MTLFGQSCLAARRLVEAGSRFVTVFWDAYEIFAGCAWDTHANHFPRLKEYLLPGMDLAFSALLTDLDTRGRRRDCTCRVLLACFSRGSQLHQRYANCCHLAEGRTENCPNSGLSLKSNIPDCRDWIFSAAQ